MLDYLIVGAGLSGATFAREMADAGKSVLVIDKAPHIAGNCYDYMFGGQRVHKYGIHVFHTPNKHIWDYVHRFTTMRPYKLIAKNKIGNTYYSSPFNLETFKEVWGIDDADHARKIIEYDRVMRDGTDVESYALRTVGKTLYEMFIRYPIQKHWGRHPNQLDQSIIARIPVRYEFNDDYYNSYYQGLPDNGYVGMVQNMLDGVPVELGVDFHRVQIAAKKIVYTGSIDRYFNYGLGKLPYRTLFITFTGSPIQERSAMVRPTTADPLYRKIDWSLVHPPNMTGHIQSYEYAADALFPFDVPMYPIKTLENTMLYEKYKTLAKSHKDVLFLGRLGTYKYIDMHQAIGAALSAAREEKETW